MKKILANAYRFIIGDCDCITYSILRIFLVALIWAKWARSFRFFVSDDPIFVITAIAFYASSFFLFIGYYSRFFNMILAFCCFWNYYYFGVYFNNYNIVHHHTYLLCIMTFLLCFTPSGKFYSVDSYLNSKKGNKETNEDCNYGPRWPLLLICFQVSMIYLWGAFAKNNALFISGASLDYIFFDLYRSYLHLMSSDGIKIAYSLLAKSTIFIEVFLAFGLWFKRTRLIACLIGFIIHVSFYVLLQVSTFSATMLLLYICFFDPSDVRKVIGKINGFNK